jgi:hypothetical protein
MSEEGSFISRWSRRKQAARTAPGAAPQPPPELPRPEPAAELPPIESLGATSDYAVFLQKGVSALVQQQALQKAWTSDAGIAAFRGMAEYDWDFNAVGYGRLRVTDDVGQLLRAVLSVPEPAPPGAAPAAEAPEPVVVRQSPPAAPLVASAGPDMPAHTVPEPTAPDRTAAEQPVSQQTVPQQTGPQQTGPQRHGSAKPV